MSELSEFKVLDLLPMLPELFLAVAGMFFLVFGAFRKDAAAGFISWSVLGCFIIAALILMGIDWQRQEVLGGMFVMDQFAGYLKLLVLIGLAASLTLSVKYLAQEHILHFEYPLLMLFAGLGMLMMVSASNFLSLYVGLELQSLSLYILAAYRRESLRSSEAGMKYFILGALSSGILLFGISLIYGYAGALGYQDLAALLAQQSGPLEGQLEGAAAGRLPLGVVIGLVFVLAGLAFKISAVPFHMWTPDVYEGAPSCVTAFFAIVPKLAAMALLIRLLFEAFPAAVEDWQQIIWLMAAASMVLGSFAALTQSNIKRLMAYSSIGNMGYALIGLAAVSVQGVAAVIVYLAIYMVMTAGMFGAILCMRRNDMATEKVEDLAGLSRHSPVLAYVMAFFLFSMSGIPPLAGFFGKFVIFKAAIESGAHILAVLGVLTSVVAAYIYLRLIKIMFFDEPLEPFDKDIDFPRRAVIFIAALFVVGFIVAPAPLIDSAQSAAQALLR